MENPKPQHPKEVENAYKYESQPNPEQRSEIRSNFRPKMLNNVDELGGVL